MRWLRILGKFLISVGVGVLLFVAWVLWGTGIYTSHQQDILKDKFDAQPPVASKQNSKTGFELVDIKPNPGDPVFILQIPKIGVNDMVVEGVEHDELMLGPGHYPDCRASFVKPLCTEQPEVFPGEEGRVIVSGHRTTYGQPFWDLNKLQKDDEIFTKTKWGDFTYKVSDVKIVSPETKDVAVADPPGQQGEIALTTCNPRFSAAQRLVVFGELVRA